MTGAVAFAFQHDAVAMMAEPVEDGTGKGSIVVEGRCPLSRDFVGGENDGALLVACADDLEEQIAALLVEREVSEFVEDEQLWSGVLAQSSGQSV